jgi:hypothetical protein
MNDQQLNEYRRTFSTETFWNTSKSNKVLRRNWYVIKVAVLQPSHKKSKKSPCELGEEWFDYFSGNDHVGQSSLSEGHRLRVFLWHFHVFVLLPEKRRQNSWLFQSEFRYPSSETQRMPCALILVTDQLAAVKFCTKCMCTIWGHLRFTSYAHLNKCGFPVKTICAFFLFFSRSATNFNLTDSKPFNFSITFNQVRICPILTPRYQSSTPLSLPLSGNLSGDLR